MRIIPIYYHLVSNIRNPLVENLYTYKSIEAFRKDLLVLKKKYKILTLADLQAGKKGLILSFDDGFQESYTVIFPILKELGIPAFFFVNNDFIDNKDMFYRAKISLLISKLDYLHPAEHQKLANILQCKISHIKKALLDIRISDVRILDLLLPIAGINIQEYLSEKRPYLSSSQIGEMIEAGYYFGGHTHDHLHLRDFSPEEQEKRIVDSAHDIRQSFSLTYSLCSLPHNDKGISPQVIKKVSSQIDYLFGGFGLNHSPRYNYYRRISNEHSSLRIDRFINNWKLLNAFIRIFY